MSVPSMKSGYLPTVSEERVGRKVGFSIVDFRFSNERICGVGEGEIDR